MLIVHVSLIVPLLSMPIPPDRSVFLVGGEGGTASPLTMLGPVVPPLLPGAQLALSPGLGAAGAAADRPSCAAAALMAEQVGA